MEHTITANQVTLNYGNKIALQDVSIQIHEKQLIGIIGRNGSGKTTFLKLCSGILEPTQGEIKIFGGNPIHNIEVAKKIIYSSADTEHRPKNHLKSILEYYRLVYPQFDMVFANKLMEICHLNPKLRYGSLSKGMASIFNFICGLSSRASLTLFDEPVVGMDISVRKKVYEILLRDYMEHPRSIIISSHILEELETILSEIILLKEGELLLYEEMEVINTMAYRVDGEREEIERFKKGRECIKEKYTKLESYAVFKEQLDETTKQEANNLNLLLSKVKVEDLYIILTEQEAKGELECLWEA